MARKSKRKKDYEAFTHGPFTLERQGRYVRFSSSLDKKQHRKFKKRLKRIRPEFRESIQEKIEELSIIISENDPFDILSSVSVQNIFSDPEKDSESSSERREYLLEYALSMALAHSKPGFGNHINQEIADRFTDLIADISNSISWYYTTEGADKDTDWAEGELRLSAIMDYLFVRGDSYLQHHIALVKDLFSPHDELLKENFNFSTEELINCASEMEKQILENVTKRTEGYELIQQSQELIQEFIKSNSFETDDEAIEQFRKTPEALEMQKKIDSVQDVFQAILFEIKPNQSAKAHIMNLISAHFGDNKNFLEFEKAPGWLGNDTIINEKPLIRHEDKYFCFSPALLYRSLINILETAIRAADQEYFTNKYQKTKRAEFLEKKSLEYLERLMPGCEVYGNLYYDTVEDGKKKRPETDGLIIFDSNLFIIEGKAGLYSVQARRGGIERIKKHASELINEAYSQALKTKKYIKDTQTPRFENKNGSLALEITQKGRIKNIFLVNVTLESLGKLSTGLNSLKKFNMIQGSEWPWSVYLNDLKTISEIIDIPSIFLSFLKKRLRANDFPQFQSVDELDFLMFFLREGLYLEDLNRDMTAFTPTGYTEPLDRYYDFLDGKIEHAEKPRLRTDKYFIELIKNIESLGKHDFTSVTTTLLDFSGETHKEIIKRLSVSKGQSDRDGTTHDFTLYFRENSLGVTFFINPGPNSISLEKMESHCRLKLYQTRLENWIGVAIDATKGTTSVYDHFRFHQKWHYDEHQEKQLQEFKATKWKRLNIKGKVGRNQPCPCGSGLKYKKCCRR